MINTRLLPNRFILNLAAVTSNAGFVAVAGNARPSAGDQQGRFDFTGVRFAVRLLSFVGIWLAPISGTSHSMPWPTPHE